MAMCVQQSSFTVCLPPNCATNRVVYNWVPVTTQPKDCAQQLFISAQEYSALMDAQTNFGWDADAFDVGVQGVLMMFVTGVGIGLIVNLVRKMRTP